MAAVSKNVVADIKNNIYKAIDTRPTREVANEICDLIGSADALSHEELMAYAIEKAVGCYGGVRSEDEFLKILSERMPEHVSHITEKASLKALWFFCSTNTPDNDPKFIVRALNSLMEFQEDESGKDTVLKTAFQYGAETKGAHSHTKHFFSKISSHKKVSQAVCSDENPERARWERLIIEYQTGASEPT